MEVSENPATKLFRNDLQRLVRRAEVFRRLRSDMPLSEIKGVVREYEKSVSVPNLVNELVSSEFVVRQQDSEAALDLSDRLQYRFPEIEAVILLGSSGHGGASIREVIDTPSKSDFDWGIVYSEKTEKIDAMKINEIVDTGSEILSRLWGKESCSHINPRKFAIQKIANLDEAEKILKNFLKMDYPLKDKTFTYFMPSFPSFINEENRKFLLEALGKLHKTDQQNWKVVTDQILSFWTSHHRIAFKHLSYKPGKMNSRSRNLARTVSEISTDLMARVFRETLLSTAEVV